MRSLVRPNHTREEILSTADDNAILFIDLSVKFGGVETRILQMAHVLKNQDKLCVAVLHGSPLHRKLEDLGVDVLSLPYRRSNPMSLLRIYQFIRNNNFRVVDSHNPQSHVWGQIAARLAGVPLRIATVHNVYRGDGFDGALRGLRNEVALRFMRIFATHFVGVSAPICDYVRSVGICDERVTLISNGFELIETAPETTEPIRGSLGWDDDDFLVIVPARLDLSKGQRFIVEAISRLRDREPRLRCLIVGEGQDREFLEREVGRLGLQEHVRLLGFRTDVLSLLRQSDLMCLPSLSEGLPLVLLEAVALDIPVLVSDIAAYKGVVEHGVTARLFPPKDVEALCRELQWCLSNTADLKRIADAARLSVREAFSVEKMVEKTLRLYGVGGNALS